jgi:hypothetical protein
MSSNELTVLCWSLAMDCLNREKRNKIWYLNPKHAVFLVLRQPGPRISWSCFPFYTLHSQIIDISIIEMTINIKPMSFIVFRTGGSFGGLHGK